MDPIIRVTILPPATALENGDDRLYAIWEESLSNGFSIEFAGKRAPVPIAECYVEVIVEGLKLAGQGIIGALAYDLVKALARGLKIEFDGWIASLREGKTSRQVEIKRQNEEEAVAIVIQALTEMYDEMHRE